MVQKTERLLSLDVFRGLTIALMILVNNPGSWGHVYPPLLHADWHGVTPTDLVFPFFLFIIGVSLYMSYSKYDHKLSKQSAIKIIKRSALIFLIGLALHFYPFYNKSFESIRIMGVLQRIGLAYLIAAFLCLSISIKNLWRVALLILIFYWTSSIIHGGENPFSIEDNWVRAIDLKVLGENHMWKGKGIPFDPEGIMSSIPAAISIVFGFYIGALIQKYKEQHLLVKNLLLVGVIAVFVGLCWSIYFPLNKSLWTSSYVIYTGGLACMVLGILVEILDVRKKQSWAKPFQVFGLNPLIIFVFSGVFVKTMLYIVRWTNEAGNTINGNSWLWANIFSQITPNHLKFSSLLMALFHLAICYLLGYVLYRKKIVIKV
ncbi:acyltransferase family protein [Roseivirga pacifica]|uniref:acyltransferase family protein n=1 Tax=Roseivirga pacifica TaxID=1267423 RepID=UPI00227BC75D|nr:heparan-alpha-glucosaminide N-acetyltransferase domain-containing protein [Roseivirga pacifica]